LSSAILTSLLVLWLSTLACFYSPVSSPDFRFLWYFLLLRRPRGSWECGKQPVSIKAGCKVGPALTSECQTHSTYSAHL
jgi:hypothetical protein